MDWSKNYSTTDYRPHDFWIQPARGGVVSLSHPEAKDLCICDIAHALANICRFTGHCRPFYSVAQHSVIVSRLGDPRYAMWKLLHDAPEMVTGDVGRPLKLYLRHHTNAFDRLEREVMACVVERFGLDLHAGDTKEQDEQVLAMEYRDLMVQQEGWDWMPAPLPLRIKPVGPWRAKRMFLLRYLELGGEPCEHWPAFIGPPRLWLNRWWNSRKAAA